MGKVWDLYKDLYKKLIRRKNKDKNKDKQTDYLGYNEVMGKLYGYGKQRQGVVYHGKTTLANGTPGTGKTLVANGRQGFGAAV
jgi:transcriptional regulator with AAA-type ATPase domain